MPACLFLLQREQMKQNRIAQERAEAKARSHEAARYMESVAAANVTIYRERKQREKQLASIRHAEILRQNFHV